MRSTVATIDTDALVWNVGVIRKRAPNARVLGMVKANAYGHGMLPVARILEQINIDMLGVAFVDEAVQLRKGGITLPIMVLTPNEPHEAETIAGSNLSVVVCSTEQAKALSAAAERAGTVVSIHVYVDTGMHRDGFTPHDVVDAVGAIKSLPGLHAEGLCTHFATADELHHPFIREQIERFERVVSRLNEHGHTFDVIHAANTGGIWQAPFAHYSMIRPGLSMYGYSSPADEEMMLRPVMSITSRVLSLRRIWPGDTVSYGQRYMASQETTIATVPIGYGDGYLRGLTGSAKCLIGGKEYPIVGTICMDECMVDVGSDPVAIGDDVVLLGYQSDARGRVHSIDAIDIAQWAHTIPYEITTLVSSRVPRQYVGSYADIAIGERKESRV